MDQLKYLVSGFYIKNAIKIEKKLGESRMMRCVLLYTKIKTKKVILKQLTRMKNRPLRLIFWGKISTFTKC